MTAAGASDGAAPRRRLGIGALIVLVIAALAITVAIGILRGASAPVDRIEVDRTTDASAGAGAELYVHVAGAVVEPGLYVLPAHARVVDAVAAAGGLTDDADGDAINLARPLSDGEQLHVPRQGESPPSASGGAPPEGAAPGGAAPGNGRVDLNTADEALLDTLPRIGPALAQRIIAWRDENGRFTSVEDLLAVPGIGDKMLESLRDLVTV